MPNRKNTKVNEYDSDSKNKSSNKDMAKNRDPNTMKKGGRKSNDTGDATSGKRRATKPKH